MNSMPNRAVLEDALEIYRREMRRFILETLKSMVGRGTPQELIDDLFCRGNAPQIDQIDIGDFPDIVRTYWKDAFEQACGNERDFLNYCCIVRSARNRSAREAREVNADVDYVRAHLTVIERALDAVRAREAAEMVEKLRDETYPLRFETYRLRSEIPFEGMTLNALRQEASGCERCRLHRSRDGDVVFGAGDPTADLLIVGLAPNRSDSLRATPYVLNGAAKRRSKLKRMVAVTEEPFEKVYVTFLLKCGLSEDRRVHLLEAERCKPYLLRQIEQIDPLVIVTLGEEASAALCMDDTRPGEFFDYNGIPSMPTHALDGPPPSAYRRADVDDGGQLRMDTSAPVTEANRMERERLNHMRFVKGMLEYLRSGGDPGQNLLESPAHG